MDPMSAFLRPEAAGQVAPARPLYDVWRERARAKQAQEEQGVILLLPSGIPVRVMRVPIPLLLQRGQIPDSLTPIVNRYIREIEAIEQGDGSAEEKEARKAEMVQADVTADQAAAYNNFLAILNFVVANAVVEPKFCLRADARAFVPTESQPEPLYLDFGPQGEYPDIDDGDKLFIYQFCQGVDQTVEEFFRRQTHALGVLPDSTDLPLSAEGTVRADELQRQLVGVPSRSPSVDVGIVHRAEDQGHQRGAAQTQAPAEHGDGAEVQRPPDQSDARPRTRRRKAGRID